jgi:hypothetical protein
VISSSPNLDTQSFVSHSRSRRKAKLQVRFAFGNHAIPEERRESLTILVSKNHMDNLRVDDYSLNEKVIDAKDLKSPGIYSDSRYSV